VDNHASLSNLVAAPAPALTVGRTVSFSLNRSRGGPPGPALPLSDQKTPRQPQLTGLVPLCLDLREQPRSDREGPGFMPRSRILSAQALRSISPAEPRAGPR
jgi:hypothetical protein